MSSLQLLIATMARMHAQAAQAQIPSRDMAPNPSMSMPSLALLWRGAVSSLGMTSMNATYRNVPASKQNLSRVAECGDFRWKVPCNIVVQRKALT